MPFTKAQLRYVLINQGAAAVVMNFVMNGLMAWLIFRPAETVPLWGDGGFAVDVVITTLFFTFFISYFVSKATHKKVRTGQLACVDWPSASRLFARFPPRPFLGSLMLAILGACIIAPLVLATFSVFGIDQLPPRGFIIFKSFYGAGLGAVVAPFIAYVAMAEASGLSGQKTR